MISDEEISGLVWLTLHVRNELMHYSPKFLSIDIQSIRATCLIALSVVESLVFKSHSLPMLRDEQRNQIQNALTELRQLFTQATPENRLAGAG